jgi:hypothetical protein
MGSPAFPFIDQGRGLGYTREKKEGKEEREKQGEEDSGAVFLFPLQAGPIRLVATPHLIPTIGRLCHSFVAFRPIATCNVVNSSS